VFALLCFLFSFTQGDNSEALTISKSSVCDSDLKLFCGTEKSLSRCAQFKCLKSHFDQLSAPCALYVKEKQLKKERCKNETVIFCSGEEGKCAIRRCLFAHIDQLNGTCAEYIREKNG